MRNLPILIGREMRALFVSPILWVVMVMTLLANGIAMWLLLELLSQPMAPEGAPMEFFFGGSILYWIPVIVVCSVIPMGAVAAERRNGTLETLMTAPVTEVEVILSKFFACLLFYLLLWVPTLVYVILLNHYGDPDMGPVASGYLGTVLVGSAFLSIGLFMSAVSSNQIVAAVLAFVSNFCLFMLGLVEYINMGSGGGFYSYINVWNHMSDWGRGIVDTRHIIYCLSLMTFSLFCSVRVLESRRWR